MRTTEPTDPEGVERPPLGCDGRIPEAMAMQPSRESAVTRFRQEWHTRNTVAMLGIGPVLFLVYVTAGGTDLGDPLGVALTAALALVGALTLSSYLSVPGGGRSSCGLVPALLVPGVAILLHEGTGVVTGLMALAVLGLGLGQRLFGGQRCG